MRRKSFKGLSHGKMKEKEKESGVVIEGATAEQLAEMQKRMDGRKKEMEDATKQLRGLIVPREPEEDEEETIGPHGPIQELTIEDIPEDDDDLLITPADDEESTDIEEPDLVETTLEATEPESAEGNDLKDLAEVAEEIEDEDEEEKDGEKDGLDLSDSFDGLFDEEESDENPLANLINNLPDVSAQELIDDIEDIRQIIKEWQQNRQNV
jgi:hypothetical protein